MSDKFSEFYANCDPEKPSTPHQYVPCTDVRGGREFASNFIANLDEASGGWHRELFTGHTGCGKSSELYHLATELQAGRTRNRRCFLPIIINATDYLDRNDVDEKDILLAILSGIAKKLKEEDVYDLRARDFGQFRDELWGLLKRDVDLNKISVADLDIELLRNDPNSRQQIRKHLRKNATPFATELNLVLDKSREKLRKKAALHGNYQDFVVIIDNLERIHGVTGVGPKGEENWHKDIEAHEQLFLRGSGIFKDLRCHLLITIPLSLATLKQQELMDRYLCDAPFVLPMIKVLQRDDLKTPFRAGVACMKQMIAKRAEPHALEEIIDDDALQMLILYSGGHVRDLIRFVKNCVLVHRQRHQSSQNSDETLKPIDMLTAREVLKEEVRDLSVPSSHWRILAECEDAKDRMIPNDRHDFAELIQQREVYKYLNGVEEDDYEGNGLPGSDFIGSVSDDYWYAVKPLIRVTKRFQEELEDYRQQHPKQGA